MRCYPSKLTNSTGIMWRTKEINSVISLKCFRDTLCGQSPLLEQGQAGCGCDKGFLHNALNSSPPGGASPGPEGEPPAGRLD